MLILKGAPIPVFFAGWESTTAALGQHGWEMAIHRDHLNLRMMVLFHHPGLRLTGCTDVAYEFDKDRPIVINHVAPAENISIHITGDLKMDWVDTQPSYETRTGTLADMDLFNLKSFDNPTVYVEQANMEVVDHLQSILDGQKDKQRELRERHKAAQEKAEATTGRIIQQIIQV